jgi:hypothetical protein
MPDPIVPSPDDPSPDPGPRPSPPSRLISGTITCEHCGCKITRADGEIVTMGDAAKKWRRSDERIDALQAELERVQAELTTEKAAHATLRDSINSKKTEKW